MTMKLTAKRFNIRKQDRQPPEGPESLFDTPEDGLDFAATKPTGGVTPEELAAVTAEGLTDRQLRMARRMASKQGIQASSDLEAVILLRRTGIDPFQRNSVVGLVQKPEEPEKKAQLPQTIKPLRVPSTQVRAETSHLTDLIRIQRDIARRRRRALLMLAARLAFFVLLPTIVAGWYFYRVATPLYSSKSEFVIQQAENPVVGGLGGMLRGTAMATSQDSMSVQGYLQSRDAMERLDRDLGFRAHFSDAHIDDLQRLAPDATFETAYKTYKRNVNISYDPTEGIVKMEVKATDPTTAVAFSDSLISYAEEQVDELTQRMREDQMAGAQEGYNLAEQKMLEAQERVVQLQEQYRVLSSEVEVTLITTQISTLETELLQDRLSLQQMEANPTPNIARMEPLKARISRLNEEIASLRARLTQSTEDNMSLAQVQSRLLMAQGDVETRQMMLAESLQSMETARMEVSRQTRYLSLSVRPLAADEPAYPRAFENTLVAMLIFAGIYLMISMTVAILREQVSS
ncbi:capsule biosynthesis protein [Falsirhodobacter xinxiangensis]|uniref:capsule biosynthesis protein n=1 Tax=Falsirhodobacter xinxiangensis TaxID=2530049 RepID=UPI0010A9B803|nr:capsule biosynthesis protein [Rhodobacter xinxiangensis]